MSAAKISASRHSYLDNDINEPLNPGLENEKASKKDVDDNLGCWY
jgi:hypothetical protein